MNGRVERAVDSDFLCLLTIYALHLLLFHVLEVAPVVGRPAAPRAEPPDVPPGGNALPVGGLQLHYQAFVTSCSARLWKRSVAHLVLDNYPKVHVDFSLLSPNLHRVQSTVDRHVPRMFTPTAWSSSTWGIISGCAVFLLTYTERENAQ